MSRIVRRSDPTRKVCVVVLLPPAMDGKPCRRDEPVNSLTEESVTYSADNHNPPRDVAFKPAGPGMTMRAHCMGCNQHRLQAGGQGRPGPRWRCSHCVAAKQGRAAA